MGRIEVAYKHSAAQEVLPPQALLDSSRPIQVPHVVHFSFVFFFFPNFMWNFTDVNEFLMTEIAADILRSKNAVMA